METKDSENKEERIDPQELISRLKKLIESIKTKQDTKNDGNEFQASYTSKN